MSETTARPKLRVAMIGAGALANQVHYPALASFDDVTIAAICDIDTQRLHATADRYQVQRRYSDYRQMVAEVAPDAILYHRHRDALAASEEQNPGRPPECFAVGVDAARAQQPDECDGLGPEPSYGRLVLPGSRGAFLDRPPLDCLIQKLPIHPPIAPAS